MTVSRSDVAPTSFDPRQRPWYEPARHNDLVQRSDLYIFASNNEPGFSLSRRFTATMPGVLGADLAASDLSHFLSRQRVTPTSVSFVFTRSGEIVAFPDEARVAALVPRNGDRRVGEPLVRTQYIEAEGSASIARMTTTRFSGQVRQARRRPDLSEQRPRPAPVADQFRLQTISVTSLRPVAPSPRRFSPAASPNTSQI
jgi:hypothetical protein